jgi:hypothetical protein
VLAFHCPAARSTHRAARPTTSPALPFIESK